MNPSPLLSSRPPSHRRGFALVFVLVTIVLTSIMVISFLKMSSTERLTSHSNLERLRAEMLAQNGVEEVTSRLRQHLGDPDMDVKPWRSQGGQLVTYAKGGWSDPTEIPLHSGLKAKEGVELNAPILSTPNRTLISGTGAHSSMPVEWIYLTRKGVPSRQLTQQGANWAWEDNPAYAPGLDDPTTGRYAYWTDDESGKVNYNLAWRKHASATPPNQGMPLGFPARVSLDALAGLDSSQADHLYEFITGDPSGGAAKYDLTDYKVINRFFNSPDEALGLRQGSPALAVSLEQNKLSLTHYNHAPELNFWGQSRIVLTCLPERAKRRLRLEDGTVTEVQLPFLDLGVTSAAALVKIPDANLNKVSETVGLLMDYLKRDDWPMAPGSSFLKKYFGNSGYSAAQAEARLAQIALNIIEYVRAKECPEDILIPLNGMYYAGKFQKYDKSKAKSDLRLFGETRRPMITEFGVHIKNLSPWWFDYAPTDPTNATHYVNQCTIRLEFFLPRNYGIPSVKLGGNYAVNFPYVEGAIPAINPTNPAATIPTATPTLMAGEPVKRLTVDFDQLLLIKRGGVTPPPVPEDDPRGKKIPVRFILYKGSDPIAYYPIFNNQDTAPTEPVSSWMQYTLHTGNPASQSINSLETDEPRLGVQKADWKALPAGQNTFGAPNLSSTLNQDRDLAIHPEQDANALGKLSDLSLYMPPPAGKTYTLSSGMVDDNRLGLVTSVAELGNVNTGLMTGEEPKVQAGVPWRTLRLQPSSEKASVVPDWALLDLFTVPDCAAAEAAREMVYPTPTASGGKVSINNVLEPFGIQRGNPIQALLLGSQDTRDSTQRLASDQAKEIADNIMSGTLAALGKNYGLGEGYLSVGQLAEVKGIADRGEGSEELMRELAGLATARGNVFTVYTVGQALQMSRSGKMVVTAENRELVILERRDSYPSTNPLQVRGATFKPVFSQTLTP